jgi:hypothetical protein
LQFAHEHDDQSSFFGGSQVPKTTVEPAGIGGFHVGMGLKT